MGFLKVDHQRWVQEGYGYLQEPLPLHRDVACSLVPVGAILQSGTK
jgi:hypothetical protein